jgi:hypothetical protein
MPMVFADKMSPAMRRRSSRSSARFRGTKVFRVLVDRSFVTCWERTRPCMDLEGLEMVSVCAVVNLDYRKTSNSIVHTLMR